MHLPMIAIVVVADIILTAVALWWVFSKRHMPLLGGMTLGEFKAFSESASGMVREYMRANYSGNAAQLPALMPELLERLESHARSNGLELDRERLKTVLTRVIESEHLAPARDVRQALSAVA
jgi:hypothetical protein